MVFEHHGRPQVSLTNTIKETRNQKGTSAFHVHVLMTTYFFRRLAFDHDYSRDSLQFIPDLQENLKEHTVISLIS